MTGWLSFGNGIWAGAKLSELTTLAQAGSSNPRRAGEALTEILEYNGRERRVTLKGKTLTISKTKADSTGALALSQRVATEWR